MDREGFEAESYVKHVLESQSLEELLKTYNQVLTGKTSSHLALQYPSTSISVAHVPSQPNVSTKNNINSEEHHLLT